MTKEDFKILTPRDHVRQRTGMYLGAVSNETVAQFVLGKWSTVQYVPALFKMVNEVLDNALDEGIRTNFKYSTKIDVSIKGDVVTVTDNGRGIPQDEIYDEVSGTKLKRPVAAWTKVNAGTSFDDNRTTIGANGVGSSATAYLSTSFIGKTWRDGTRLEVHCTDGTDTVVTKEVKHPKGSGTEVSFQPDFSFFEANSLADGDLADLVEDRLVNLQLAFPEITFTFNKKRLAVRNNFKHYAGMFTDGSVVLEKSENLSFFFVASDDGFRTNSFINGVNTRLGGTYVDWLMNGVLDELQTLVKRKHKVEVSKSVLKNGLTLVLFARNFTNPKFDSQTKERLTNSNGDVKSHYEASIKHDFKHIARRIFACQDIIEPIIAAQIAKKNADDRRNALVAQKKLKKVKVAKHVAANSPDATLSLVEGLSALGFALKVRDPNKIGFYPLRGVVLNTWTMKPADVLKNKELSEVIAILGLDINDPDSVDNMTYKNIATLCDADMDGAGHIAPLLIGFFYRFWPRLFTEGRVHVTRSPIMISTNGKQTEWFYDVAEASKFKETATGYTHRYIKGLGSLQESEYDRVINDPVLDCISVDDAKWFQLMFGPDADVRKEFMMA